MSVRVRAVPSVGTVGLVTDDAETVDAGDGEFRIEHDTMGEVRVPAAARWGAQTQRAVENFPISGVVLERVADRARSPASRARRPPPTPSSG